jgi:hypothetical protein
MLLELERKLREAKPVASSQVLASGEAGPALAR